MITEKEIRKLRKLYKEYVNKFEDKSSTTEEWDRNETNKKIIEVLNYILEEGYYWLW
jgi:hypothetical protein